MNLQHYLNFLKQKQKTLYEICEKLDEEYPYRIDDTRIHKSTACKVMNVTEKQLLLQITIEENKDERSF